MVTNIVARAVGSAPVGWPETAVACMAMLCVAYIVGKLLS